MVDLNDMPLDVLFTRLVDREEMQNIIAAARREDLGEVGDITSQILVPKKTKARAQIVARKAGVLAGAVLLKPIAQVFSADLDADAILADGTALSPGDVIAEIRGPLQAILAAERTMLNFLTHLSGIATLTARYVTAIYGSRAGIYDTRKTTPGLRTLEKYAVRCGGGRCLRIGLYDAVLIKDNHISGLSPDELPSVLDQAIARARELDPPPTFIEVEVDTLEQLRAVLSAKVDIVLLDNMNLKQLRDAAAIRDNLAPKVKLEASGGVSLETVAAIAETGVDRISVGALTHSAPALDLGLDIEPGSAA